MIKTWYHGLMFVEVMKGIELLNQNRSSQFAYKNGVMAVDSLGVVTTSRCLDIYVLASQFKVYSVFLSVSFFNFKIYINISTQGKVTVNFYVRVLFYEKSVGFFDSNLYLVNCLVINIFNL